MMLLPAQQAQTDQLVPPAHPGQLAHGMLNWSNFRPEFSGKPEEDAEMYLLRTNDWMETQRFCLTLTGEVRLWYESLRPNAVRWPDLQDQFR